MTEAEELELLRLRKRKAMAAQAAQMAEPAPMPPTPQPSGEATDWLTALGRGAAQGATLNSADEINGAIQALGERYLPESWGGGGEQAQRRSLLDLYRGNRDAFRAENAAAQRDHAGFYLGGNVLAGLPLALATGGGAGSTATLGSLLKSGAALGSAGGFLGSDADLTRGEFGRAAFDTGLGGLFGTAGSALGYGLGKGVGAGASWLSTKAAQKAAQATEKIAQLAEKSAGEVTQSARSAAGTAATAAYKNAANIEEAIKAGAMTLEDLAPEQLSLYRALLRERAQKAAQQLAEDAGRKTAKAAEYSEVLASAPGRTEEALGRIGNPVNQLWPRLKTYGPVALGAAAGHYLFPGMGIGGGGFAGAALRPTIRALMRMTRHPSVARPLWNTLGGLANGVGYGSREASLLGGPSGRALAPEFEQALMPMLLASDDPESPGTQPALAAALRSGR